MQDIRFVDLVVLPENMDAMAAIVIMVGKCLRQRGFAKAAQAMQANMPSRPERTAHLYQIPFASDEARADKSLLTSLRKCSFRIKLFRKNIGPRGLDKWPKRLVLIDDGGEPFGQMGNFRCLFPFLFNRFVECFTCVRQCARNRQAVR